jgi:hypothetical protein
LPCEQKRGLPRRDRLCACRRAGSIERLSGEHHAIISHQPDAARGALWHVHDRHTADRVAVAQALVRDP